MLLRAPFLAVVVVASARVVSGGESDGEPAAFDGVRWRPLSGDAAPDPAPQPPATTRGYASPSTLVFVNVAAYRDGRRCGRTLQSLFSEAKYPARVRVGVVQQVSTPASFI